MFNTSFKIVAFNCNSVIACPSRRTELINFLRNNKVTVALLSETFLKTEHSFQVPQYNVVRTDNEDGRGAGTAILLHESVSFRRVRPPRSVSFRDVTGVQMYDHTDTCTLFSVYVPNNVRYVNKR